MKIKQLLNVLKGTQTTESVMNILNINKSKAVYLIFRLRKAGFVKTERLSNNKRVYHISFENKLDGYSPYELINDISPVKVVSQANYRIHGNKKDVEEALIFALKSGSLRTILASLALFKKVKRWSKLHDLAKVEHVERKIGALYDLARKIMKTRHMDERFRKNALPKKNEKFEFIIQGLKSDDFVEIESKWKVRIPFNKNDLEAYL
jgi:hypothetical protein